MHRPILSSLAGLAAALATAASIPANGLKSPAFVITGGQYWGHGRSTGRTCPGKRRNKAWRRKANLRGKRARAMRAKAA